MFGMGMQEILIILLIIVLLFGATKLPQLARALGQSAKELKKGFNDTEESDSDDKPLDEPKKKDK